MENAYNRGQLLEDYRLFHSTDRRSLDFSSHYHDFTKVVFCLGGSVHYTIEGTLYSLAAGDILIIPRELIHHSSIPGTDLYERYILWIKPSFLERWQEPSLDYLLTKSHRRTAHFTHPSPQDRNRLVEMLKSLSASESTAENRLLTDTYLLQFLLTLSQLLSSPSNKRDGAVRDDPRLNELLDHINNHLTEDLSIDALAERFYVSPSHLMHRFSTYTGCSLHRYITQRRLICAADKIRAGMPILMAYEQAGFREYSTFLKAFKKQYLCTPNDWRQS